MTFIRFVFTLTVLSSVLNTYGQKFTNQISKDSSSVIAYWGKKDQHRYHVIHTEESYRDDLNIPKSKKGGEYDISLRVLDSTEHSYDVELKYSNVKTTAHDSIEIELAKIVGKCKVIYRINELGSFIDIKNKKEIATAMSNGLAELSSQLDTKYKDTFLREILRMSINSLVPMLRDENNIASFFSDDILMLHGYYGILVTAGKDQKGSISYPVFSDQVVQGTASIHFVSMDKLKNECRFSINEFPVDKELPTIMEALLVRCLPVLGAEVDLSKFKVTAQTKRDFTMQLSSGWMKNISFDREFNFNYDGKTGKEKVIYKFVMVK